MINYSYSAFLGFTGLKKRNERKYFRYIESIASFNAKRNSVIGLTVPLIKQAGSLVWEQGLQHLPIVDALYPYKAAITAICDVQKIKVEAALEELSNSGHEQKPAVYSGSLDVWKEMIKRDDIDLIIISTPWEDHAQMCIQSMQQGKHVAVEVPAAYTLEDLWKLIDTAEETQRNCMMMENVCYGGEELWILNMAQQGYSVLYLC
jgi:predicted dehydrogenase